MLGGRAPLLFLTALACAPHEPAREPAEICPLGMVHVEGGRLGGKMIEGLCLDVEEVTAAAYGACIDAGSCTPALGERPGSCTLRSSESGDDPVNCVDLAQASAYCTWLGKRLPKASEWAWAAGGRSRAFPYPWGSEPVDPRRACIGRSPEQGTCAVGSAPAGASPEGVVDLVGNVAEWVIDREATATDPASGSLVGRDWSTALPASGELLPLRSGAGGAVPAVARGMRCAVAPRTQVLSPALGRWRPQGSTPRELPLLAEHFATQEPSRPLANLAIFSQGGDTWWPLGDRYIQAEAAAAVALGLRDPLRTDALPDALQHLSPSLPLGTMTLWRGGWSGSLQLVALDRARTKIIWEKDLSAYGRTYLDIAGRQTVVVAFYGDKADSLVGFALDDGAELWRIEGGDAAEIRRIGGLRIDGERGYAQGDRGVMAFDLVSGGILWSQVPLAEGCGVGYGDGQLVVEGESAMRVLDPSSGEEVARFARPDGETGCRWGRRGDDWVAEGSLAGGLLYTFGKPTKDRVATLSAVDLETGAVRWRRAKLDADVLVAYQDAVYVSRGGEFLLALDATTGEPAVEYSTAGAFSVEVVGGGGEAGPLVVVETENVGTWVMGRAPEPVPLEPYTIRGRLLPEEGVPKRQVNGFEVRVGERWRKTGRGGHFRGKGKARGAIAVATQDEQELYERSEHAWGPFYRSEAAYVMLDGSGDYDVGDLELYRWYNE